MASPARQRIIDAALVLIRERGIGRVTTREIAAAAGVAEGSLFKNFGDKMGLLTQLVNFDLPENRAWRALAEEPPSGDGGPVAALVVFLERAADFYVAVLPLHAGSFADRELLRRHQELNREHGSGPQLAIAAAAECLRGWQQSGHLDPAADPRALGAALCGGALMCAYIEQLAGAEQVPGGRASYLRSLVSSVIGPYVTAGPPGKEPAS